MGGEGEGGDEEEEEGRERGRGGRGFSLLVIVNTKFAMCVVEHCTPPHDITIDPSHLSSGTSPQDTTMLGSLLHTAHLTAVRWPSRV